jgi:hybrid cluster-associated redox disulfide protein
LIFNAAWIYLNVERISKDMLVETVLAMYPGLAKVFIDSGLPCMVCGQPCWGTVADLAEKYHVNVKTFVDKLNEDLKKTHEKL